MYVLVYVGVISEQYVSIFPLGPRNLKKQLFLAVLPSNLPWSDEATLGYSCVVQCEARLPVTNSNNKWMVGFYHHDME
jgi:hypothetical protein